MLQPLIHTLTTRKRYRRAGLAVAAGLVLLVLVSQVAAPLLISTAPVRNGMESAVERWFGHDATIKGDPELHFWPRPHITLRDVTIRETDDPGSRMIAHVEQLSASFRLFRALRGEFLFEDYHLVRPKIVATRDGAGAIDWSMDGLLDDAVRDVMTNGVPEDDKADTALGEITVENGTVEIIDASGGRSTIVTGVNGVIEWPRLSRPVSSSLSGTLNGRTFTLAVTSTQPLALLAGHNADADLSVTSELFSGRFSGNVNLAKYAFLSGALTVTVPRVADTLDWLAVRVTGLDRLQQLSLNAQLTTAGNAVRFEQVSVQANEASASGIMDLVANAGERPRLTGTLAFDRLNFSAILSALSPQRPGADGRELTPAALLGDLVDLDLRLSSAEAQLGPLPLRDAAVSMLNTQRMARIDLVDSTAEGGRLTGQISAPEGRIGDGAEIKLLLRDADLASAARRFGGDTLLPEATGSVELALRLSRPLGIATVHDLTGSLRTSAQDGRLVGVDMAAVRRLGSQSPYFSLKDASDGAVAFNRLTVSARIANGMAEVGEAQLEGPEDVIVMNGLVPLETNGLALSAQIRSVTGGVPTEDPMRMFIGGAWPDAVLWPLAKPSQPSQSPPEPAAQ